MSARRRTSIIAIGALMGALLVPMAGAGAVTAATLDPAGLETGFQIDGDKAGGTPPGTFDWDSILTPPVPDGSFAFTPTGPYTTADGLQSTGILDATFAWDNGSLNGACAGSDATGAPGSQTPNSIPWAPGPANVNDKSDLCSTGSAYEVVTDAQGLRHAILYAYWTRLAGNGSMSLMQDLRGPAAGRCDDVLVVFDYESNDGTMTVHFRRWTPAAADGCTNPNGAGQWLDTGETLDFAWAVGVRTEGPQLLGDKPEATFGEFGVDLTTAGLFDPTACSTFAVSTQLTGTGSSFTTQTQDYLNVTDPLTISNCGALSVTKAVVPAGFESDERFAYRVDRASGGTVLPDTDAAAIVDDLGIDETDTVQNVLAASDYRLSETVASPWVQESIVCTTTQPGTGAPIQFVLASPTDSFTVYPETQTDCVITNAISTVTVTKQTLPDGSPEEFSFDIGGNPATLTDGQSATFAFAPGSTIDISEVVPAGWMGAPDITCTDPDATINEADAAAEVTTVAGQDVSCTFTNTQAGTIVISKEAFGTPPNTVFDFTGTWTSGSPALPAGGGFSIDAETGDGTNYTQTFTGVTPGSYSVTEPADQHGTLLGSLICTIGGEDVIFDAPTATFDLAPGDTVICYYANVLAGHILVVKESDPFEYDEDFGFRFGPSGAQPTENFTLNPLPGQATWDSPPLAAGQYDITEDLGDLANWTLTGITCDVSDGTTPTVDLGTLTATVDLPTGGIAQCVFNNTADPVSLRLEKTATGIADDFPWSFDFLLTELETGEARTITLTSEAPSIEVTDIAPGVEYSLVEVPQPGWTSSLDCDVVDTRGTAEDGWQFTLQPGTSFACTAENTAAPASVAVTKTVTGVTSDYEWSFPFALTPFEGVTPAGGGQAISGTGPGSQSASWTGLLPGETYMLSEQAAPGWAQGTLICTGADDSNPNPATVTFVAQPGVAVACAIENTPAPIDITITKTALGGDSTFQYVLTPLDPPGEAIVSSVATANGTGTATFTGLTPGGLYSLSELDQPGWIEGELVCTVAHADGETADLDVTGFRPEPGDQISCGIENAAVGRITIIKNVEGDDAVFDFTGTWLDQQGFSIETSQGTGTATFTNIAPGAYEVTEVPPNGYNTTALVCEDSDPQGGASTVDALVGSIVLDPGESVVCTFTNTQLGTIVISKEAFGTPANTAFGFVGDWPGLPADGEFSINTETGDGTNYTRTFTDIPSGQYSVTEPPDQHGTLLASLICTIGGVDVVFDAPTANFDLAPGDTVTCYYANVTPGQILVIKSTDPLEYDQDFNFAFEGPGGTTTPFTLNPLPGQATAAFDDLFAGEYVITEDQLGNWTLTDVACTGVAFIPDLAAGTATVTLPTGGAGSCTFTNTAAPASVTVDKTVEGVSADYDWSFGFTLDPAAGDPPIARQTITGTGPSTESATWEGLIPGQTYTLTENVAPGWEVGDLTCIGLTDLDGTLDRSVTFIAAPGLTLTCAITNTAEPASVTVDKTVEGVAAGYAWSFGFTLDPADGVTPGASQTISGSGASTESATSATWEGLTPGETYTLTEDAVDGWEAGELTCDRLTDTDTAPESVTFIAAPGLTLTCSITNTAEPASVTVDKTVDGVTAGYAWSFGFTLDPADGVTPGASQDISGTGPSTESAVWEGLLPGQTYTLTENPAAGWTVGTLTCEGLADLDPALAGFQFETAPEQTLTCAITNTAVPADLTVTKTVAGVTADYDWEFGFTLDPAAGVSPGASQTIGGTGATSGTASWNGLVPGETYTLTENAASGWTGGTLTCQGLTDLDTVAPGFTFEATPGQILACAVTNTAVPASVSVEKTVEGVTADYAWSFGFTLDPAVGVTPSGSQTISGTGATSGTATWGGLVPGETYTLTENAASGWTGGTLTCQGLTDLDAVAPGFTFEAAPGQILACAVTNTATPASVSIEKTVAGVTADYAWSFGFTLDPAVGVTPGGSQTINGVGPMSGTATWNGLVPGETYTLTEDPAAGWTGGTLTCEGITDTDDVAESVTFVAAPGLALTCAITNTAAPADLTVTKTVAGVTSTYAWEFGFTLDPATGVTPGGSQTVSGTGASTESAGWEGLLPGETYTLTEDPAPGWTAGTLSCEGLTDTDPALAGFQFIAAPGQVLACAITNTAAPIDLTVTKTALGGDATFQFVLTPIDPAGEAQGASITTTGGAGVTTFTDLVAGGTYSLSETDQPGWTEGVLTCTVTHADSSTEVLDVTGFPVQPGDSIACEITNDALGRIVIVKNVEGPDGEFDFTGTWLEPSDFSIETTAGTGSASFEDVPAGSYAVVETDPVGYDNTAVTCQDGNTDGLPSSDEGLAGAIALDPGETVICTFTNTQWGTILVDKTTLPAGSEQEFGFEWGPDNTAFTLTDEAEAYSTGLVAPGDYTISETSDVDGWALTGITCIGADGEPVVDGSSVSVQVPLQATVLCEFTNALQAPLLFDKSLVGSPKEQSDGSYIVDYEITVENPGGLGDVYDLDDRLLFGAGITVVSATVASLNGVAVDPTWNGIDAIRVATDVAIPGGVVHTYTVTARATVPSAIAIDVADCTAAPGEGTGLLNTANLTFTNGQADDSACAPVPASLPPTGGMVVGLWLGLVLLLGGAVLFLLRRRNRTA